MGYRKGETKEEYNARMNEYMKAKYFRQREKAIEYLGGKCVDCHTTVMLEFDHVGEKSFAVGAKMNGSWSVLVKELDKCVLRCVGCHAHVTAARKLANVNVLGSWSMYG